MIELDFAAKTPLYEQLYAALAADIRQGALPPGQALPGRRSMAARLGVSVSTVDTAYQMLSAEGLAEALPRRGFLSCASSPFSPDGGGSCAAASAAAAARSSAR